MDPSKDNEWLGCKNDPVDEAHNVGNIARSWQWRERGVDPPNFPSNKKVLEDLAEDILVQKELKIRCCDLPGSPRSTFLMVFSPDGTKVASSHGNHSVYVSEVATGKHVRKLKGHPRTPWCIAFHPSHPQLIGSGCLAGQVRVWDISNGGSEVWNVRNETVIASIAFHPREQLLVIATYNELYFWDWSQPAPFSKVCTNNINEKVRYVAFDALGYKLITGISLWGSPGATTNSSVLQQTPIGPIANTNRRDDPPDNPTTSTQEGNDGNTQDMIVNSYQNLVQRYDSLVRNYQRLFMVRHRLTNTPPPPNTTDRGTDPMETDNAQNEPLWRQIRPSTSSNNDDAADPSPSTSRRTDAVDSGDGEGSSSRLLNLDVLSFNNESPRSEENSNETASFGSRQSAFQPLNESARRSFRTVEQSERTRLLPNPFSSASTQPRAGRRRALSHPAPRPPTTDSATQMSPAHTINESLDLIRDILRDSGTRLLNLITDMSLSTLASVDRGGRPRPRMRMRRYALASTSDSDSDHSLEVNILRTRNSTFRDDSTEDIDETIRETLVEGPGSPTQAAEESAPTTASEGPPPPPPTDRLVFDIGDESHNSEERQDTGGINVTASGGRFRVRTQSATEPTESEPEHHRSAPRRESSPRPSTSRDNFWTRGCFVPPDEAFRKVRGGVVALQKHTSVLSNMWLRGARTGLRELRTMWENLRRRVLALHRDTGRLDLPSYYTRSLLERCMMLSDVTTRPRPRPADGEPVAGPSSRGAGSSAARISNNLPARGPGSPAARSSASSPARGADSPPARAADSPPRTPRTPRARSSPPLRRRLHPRWRPEDELLRRRFHYPGYRLWQYHSTRSRRDLARAVEISATRHEIRMRAMQVLSVMFNMMMMCLEERGLSQLIITMLRSLKRALALTCLMLMTNRTSNRSSGSQTSTAGRRVPSLDVVRIQNEDHQGPVNVDEPEESVSPRASPRASPRESPHASPRASTSSGVEEERPKRVRNNKPENYSNPSTSQDVNLDEPQPSTSAAADRWSNRLAVQIAEANRNNSITARNRRDLYLECKRQKALHRTNPNAHPITKKRFFPPVINHRIPVLRRLPVKPSIIQRTEQMATDEPVAGPSGLSSTSEQNNENPRGDVMNEFEHRVNLIRIAHMQAVRLRNATRNRIRRLQTIRLYTPSSVREMFTLQSTNTDAPSGNRSPGSSDIRRRFITYRPFSAVRNEGENRSPDEVAEEIQAVFNNTTVMRVNQVPPPDANANHDQQDSPPMRMPRIHEYLQPIILAQNAMVVDEDGNGEGVEGAGGGGGGGGRIIIGPQRVRGMAGLLDAGIISEALPAPSHRVQAWDFTTGDAPDIADNTKNVVVQRCRIHNDASIDISKDGRLLVALLPVPRLRNTNHWLGVYSLEWRRLGQCLHTAVLEQSAVSVALSPTARHLAVGLGSRRFTTLSHTRNNVFALLYKLEPLESSSRTGLSPIKELEQNWGHGFTSLNCLRWAPQPGQGLVYANNTGELIIMS